MIRETMSLWMKKVYINVEKNIYDGAFFVKIINSINGKKLLFKNYYFSFSFKY